MPVKHKEKKRAASSETMFLVSVFMRYNRDKITVEGIKKFLTAVFYKLGYTAELNIILLWKKVKKVCYILYRYAKRIYKEIKIFTERMLGGVLEDVGFPLVLLKKVILNIRNILRRKKTEGKQNTKGELRAYLRQGLAKYKNVLPKLVPYIMPAICFAIMSFVIIAGLNANYAIEVSLDGESMGYVKNYTVVNNADSVIKNKLVTLDDSQQWNMVPQIKMVNASGKDIIDERQLSDKILQASDEDIISATGLYVDGKFYGAVEDATKVQAAIDGLIAPYQDGSENKTVEFVQDVNLTSGIFFSDTIVKEKDLVELVTGLIEGEVWYTAVAGDSPSLIATKNNLRLKELYNLNPGLEDSGVWIGDQLLVSQAVPFLQVKEVVREVREVEVAFSREQKANNSMTIGKTKTVQKGEKGLNRVTVDVTYIDGIAQSETIINTEIVKEPVKEIIEVGRYVPNVGVIENAGSGAFGWPTGGGVYTSRGFAGQYPAHNGIDIAGPYGTPIYASDSGVVTTAKYTNRGYGVYVIINHGNGFETLYGHCSSLTVSYGQQVTKGQLIGYMGSTGNSTGNHLHFEIKSGNYRYDPARYLY